MENGCKMMVIMRLKRGLKLPGKGLHRGSKSAWKSVENGVESGCKMLAIIRLRRDLKLPGKGLQRGFKKCLEKRGKLWGKWLSDACEIGPEKGLKTARKRPAKVP